MLLLSRKLGERIRLFDSAGEQIAMVVVHAIDYNNVRLGFEASRDISIYREEVYQRNLRREKGNTELMAKLSRLVAEEDSNAATTVKD